MSNKSLTHWGCRTCNSEPCKCKAPGSGFNTPHYKDTGSKDTSTTGGLWDGIKARVTGGDHKDTSRGLPLSRRDCTHDGGSVAFVLSENRMIYGARGSSLTSPGAKVGHLDLILDMSGTVKPRPFLKSPGRRFAGLNALAWPEVVNIHWPDMTAPDHVRLAFWKGLLARLPHRTCLSCIGSHGRTGTAMAALLVADGYGASEATAESQAKVIIAHVRGKHCARAIETASQEAYILSLVRESRGAR